MANAASFSCGDYEFTVVAEPEVLELIESIFVDLSVEAALGSVWTLTSRDSGHRLDVDGQLVMDGIETRLLGPLLTSTLTRAAVDATPMHLHLHAASVTSGGSVLCVAGPSGAGKSTLVTALVGDGAAYVSDELLSIHADGAASGFPKPISIKKFGFNAVRQILGAEPPGPPAASWEIPGSSIGAVAPIEQRTVGTFAWYRHEADAAINVAPLHRATLIRRLLSDSQDAKRFGSDALELMARAVANTVCVEATGSDVRSLARRLHLLSEAPTTRATVVLVSSPCGDAMSRLDCRSLIIDGRALVWLDDPVRVVELDEVLTTWWVLLDGTDVRSTIDGIATEEGTPRDDVRLQAQRVVKALAEGGLLRNVVTPS